MGLDLEVQPVKNLSVQGTLLIDDLNFGTLFSGGEKDGKIRTDNRFAWQFGGMWNNAFTIPSMTAILEYTRLNPFIYTHRTNKSNYTSWGISIGHELPPNSDEISAILKYNITRRLGININYKFQRSADGFIIRNDTLIVNYGGNINRGDGDIKQKHVFLEGDRVNRSIISTNILWEPIRQVYLEGTFVFRSFDLIYNNKKSEDRYWYLTLRMDY
jgi:hypothetical protein